MRGVVKQLFAVFLLLLITITLFANNNRSFDFRRLNISNGLSQSNVNCMIQDKQGYIWIGTDDGLNRFDGYGFKQYYSERKDTTSLISNRITSLYEDNAGQLWVGTVESGTCIYNREQDNFIQKKIITDRQIPVTDIIQDNYGVLYFATNSGVFMFDPIKNETKIIESLIGSSFTVLEFGKDSILYVGSQYSGVGFLDKDSMQIKRIEISDPEQNLLLESTRVTDLFFDNNEQFWIITKKGFFYYDKKELKTFKKSKFNTWNIGQPSWECIAQDHYGSIWIGSENNGVNLISNTYNEQIIEHNNYNPLSISNNNIQSILIDNQDNIWLGHYGGGISMLPSHKKNFSTIARSEHSENTLSHEIVNAVFEDSKGRLWIGTWGGGLNLFDRKTNYYTHFKADATKPNTISNNVIRFIFEDYENNIWVCTNNGLCMYNERDENFIIHQPPNWLGTPIYMMIEDKPGVFLIVSSGAGLIEYKWKTRSSVVYNRKNSSISSDFIRCIAKDKDNNLWLGTHGSGIHLLNRSTNEFHNFKFDKANDLSLSNNVIYVITIDRKDNVWIGTMGGGLNYFNKKDSTFKVFTRNDGLPNDVVNGIKEDARGNIWLSTNKGISKYTPPYYYRGELIPLDLAFEKGEKGYFKNFDTNYGLQSNEFKPNCFAEDSKGRFYFGGVQGLSYFYPDSVSQKLVFPKVIINDLLLFNKEVTINEDAGSILQKHISLTERIVLKHQKSFFTLKFTALHYAAPEYLNYAYRLVGFNDEWNYVGNKRSATYTNLDPGEYEFEVIASNNAELWDYNATKLQIKILPPYYRTKLAYGLYLILLVSFIWFLRWNIKRRARINFELKENKNETDRLREVDEMKMKFFTNISHEFKTPLSLISGPLDLLLVRFKEDKKLFNQLSLMQRNTKHLLRLINQLLDLRKLEIGNLSFKASTGDFIQFVKEITSSFEQTAKHKDIDLTFTTELNSQLAWFNPDWIEKIVFNLLSNAFKFTPAKGSIRLNICKLSGETVESEFNINNINNEDFLKVTVEDSGIGIAPEYVDKVFNRFFQVPSSISKNKEGTGIGLSLVKDLIELHNGGVDLKSEEGKGSKFTFILPIGQKQVEINKVQELELKYSGNHAIIDDLDESHETNIQKEKILLVDDNHDIIEFMRESLKDIFEVLEASNGIEGLALAKEHFPAIIITDVMMPIMDGLEFCEKIKSNRITCHIPVIMLSAKTSDDSQISGIESGADDYIAKPFNIQILKKKVARLIDNQQRLKDYIKHNLTFSPKEVTVTSQDEKFMAKVMEIIEENMPNSEFTVEDFTKEIGMCNTQFYSKLKALTGMSANSLLRSMRLKRAVQLLEAGVTSISDIAYDVGFNNPKYFSKCFKEEFGKVPSSFMKK
jgi:signal transduction histidine kinase/ligand-binding sensor domain-containing protein/DNA-binding response OmpR family regulator